MLSVPVVLTPDEVTEMRVEGYQCFDRGSKDILKLGQRKVKK